jgi:hypothetical protein
MMLALHAVQRRVGRVMMLPDDWFRGPAVDFDPVWRD